MLWGALILVLGNFVENIHLHNRKYEWGTQVYRVYNSNLVEASLPKGAFTPKAKLFFASPKTREFTRSTVHRVLAISVEALREGRGLSPCLVSVKTVIISFIHQNN